MALRYGNAVVAVVTGTQLADETADIRCRKARIDGILDLAAADSDTGRRRAAETAALGLAARVVGNASLFIDTVRESGVLGRADEAADMLGAAGYITARRAVRERGGSGRQADKTARIFRSVGHFGLGGAIRIGSGYFGITDETAHMICVGGDGRAREDLAVPEIRNAAGDAADEAAHVLDARGYGRLDGAVREGGRNGRSTDEATRIELRGTGKVLLNSHIHDMAVYKAGRNLVFVIAGNVHVSSETAHVTGGTLYSSILHPAGDDASGGTRMPGETSGIVGARDRRILDSDVLAGTRKTRGYQETGHDTLFRRAADLGAVKDDIADGTVQHAGETGIGASDLQAGDGMAATIEIDGFPEASGRVQRSPRDGRCIHVLQQLEPILEGGLVRRIRRVLVQVHHVLQLAGVGDEVRILRRSVASHEVLQGQFHARDGVHLAGEDGLLSLDGERSRIHLVRSIGDIDLLRGTIGQRYRRPRQHHISGEHLLRRSDIHILKRQSVVHAIEAKGRFLEGRDAFRELCLQLDGRSLPEAAAVLFGPSVRECDFGIIVHAGQERLEAEMVCGAVSTLGGKVGIIRGLVHGGVGARTKDIE